MLRSGTKVPQNRLIILRKKSESVGFVLRPGADMRRRQIARIIHVEAKQRAHLGLGQQGLRARKAFAAQPVKVDALFPIDRHGSVCFQGHMGLLTFISISGRMLSSTGRVRARAPAPTWSLGYS